jgi:thioredoxin-related protein
MKKNLLITLGALLPFIFNVPVLFAQNSTVQPVSLEQALQMAPQQDKKILIDVYAAWCPYCQRMHSDVYTHQDVLDAISDYFIWVKINVESDNKVNYMGAEMTEAEFARALNNRNIPTTYFLNQSGEILGVQPGYIEEGTFSNLLNFVGSNAFLNQTFDEYIQQR